MMEWLAYKVEKASMASCILILTGFNNWHSGCWLGYKGQYGCCIKRIKHRCILKLFYIDKSWSQSHPFLIERW